MAEQATPEQGTPATHPLTGSPRHPLRQLEFETVHRFMPRGSRKRVSVDLTFIWRGERYTIHGATGREILDFAAFRCAAAEVGAYGLPDPEDWFGLNLVLERLVVRARQEWL